MAYVSWFKKGERKNRMKRSDIYLILFITTRLAKKSLAVSSAGENENQCELIYFANENKWYHQPITLGNNLALAYKV